MASPTPTTNAGRWIIARRFLQVALACWVGFAVWMIGFRNDDEAVEVLPDTQEMFSLDLEVIATIEHDLVYVVEQRARPAYRIFSFDPASGEIETVFTIPENAVVYGIALSPDGTTLAVAYTTDLETPGNGIWLLDLADDDGALAEVSPTTIDVYLTDLAWSDDGRELYATRIDRNGEDEQLDVASVSPTTGEVEILIENGIGPTPVGDALYHLTVDAEGARRSIGVVRADGSTAEVPVGDGSFDLDHLVPGTGDSTLQVATIETQDEPALPLTTPAGAHGNHDVPSTWWRISAASADDSTPTDIEPIIVYDAASDGGPIASVTLEGLSITQGDDRVDLIESRALRFITT